MEEIALKVILVLSVVLVLFALIFPVAAAWGTLPEESGDTPPASDVSDGPGGGSPFYVPDTPDTPQNHAVGGDSGVTVRLLDGGEVREMSLFDYLTLSVAAEMPAEFEPEALRAQAVALRTYYLYKLSHPVHVWS